MFRITLNVEDSEISNLTVLAELLERASLLDESIIDEAVKMRFDMSGKFY